MEHWLIQNSRIGSGATVFPHFMLRKVGLSFEEAKAFVVKEYLKVGEGAIEWYDIKYWFQVFPTRGGVGKVLMERYTDKINVYPDVNHILERLKEGSHWF